MEHLATILAHIPARRQTLLFSATMTEDAAGLARVGCAAPIFKWAVTSSYVPALRSSVAMVTRAWYSEQLCNRNGRTCREATVTKLDQRYIFIPTQVKDCYLYTLLNAFTEGGSMIIFVGTCKYVMREHIHYNVLNVWAFTTQHCGSPSMHSQHTISLLTQVVRGPAPHHQRAGV